MKSNKKQATIAAAVASVLAVSAFGVSALAEASSTASYDYKVTASKTTDVEAGDTVTFTVKAADDITEGFSFKATVNGLEGGDITVDQGATGVTEASGVVTFDDESGSNTISADATIVTFSYTVAQDADTVSFQLVGEDGTTPASAYVQLELADDTSDETSDETSGDDTSVDSDLNEPDESNSGATIDEVEEKPIDSANNAVEETTEISVTPGTKTTDASGVAITIDAEDSTAAKFTVTPPAKTTDVQTWVTDTVTTTDSTKVAELNKALAAVADGKAFALDFDLTDENGDPVDLTKPVTVAVPVPTNFAESINDIKVYHVTAEGLVLVESTVEDGAIVFTTTGFSPYIFSTEDLLTVAAPDESGKDNVGTGIALATIPVVIAGAAVVVAARKRKNG